MTNSKSKFDVFGTLIEGFGLKGADGKFEYSSGRLGDWKKFQDWQSVDPVYENESALEQDPHSLVFQTFEELDLSKIRLLVSASTEENGSSSLQVELATMKTLPLIRLDGRFMAHIYRSPSVALEHWRKARSICFPGTVMWNAQTRGRTNGFPTMYFGINNVWNILEPSDHGHAYAVVPYEEGLDKILSELGLKLI